MHTALTPWWRRAAARIATLALVLCIPPGTVTHAQLPRAIRLPDTLGANFAIADSAKALGDSTDYDFAIGVWHFRFQSRRPDGTYWPPYAGHWSFEKKPLGLLIVDTFRRDDPELPYGVGTYTVRTFSRRLKVWQMMGTSAGGAEHALGLTWSDGANRYAVQRYGSALMRIRYFDIHRDHFLWRADRSSDGGITWTRDHWIMEANRIAR